MKYWWNIRKNKNGGQEVTLSVLNQRKTLEIMWVNIKVWEKKGEKVFMEELKTY